MLDIGECIIIGKCKHGLTANITFSFSHFSNYVLGQERSESLVYHPLPCSFDRGQPAINSHSFIPLFTTYFITMHLSISAYTGEIVHMYGTPQSVICTGGSTFNPTIPARHLSFISSQFVHRIFSCRVSIVVMNSAYIIIRTFATPPRPYTIRVMQLWPLGKDYTVLIFLSNRGMCMAIIESH